MENDNLQMRQYWERCLGILERELMSTAYTTWVKPLRPYKIFGDEFILITQDETSKTTIEHRYISYITDAVETVTSSLYTPRIILASELNSNGLLLNSGKKVFSEYAHTIIKKYQFDNFVKGKSNELAFAASVAVAESPGETMYNPLFLYGGVGLGKTHLLHSIGNFVLHDDPSTKVLYTSAENLMNEFVMSIREKRNQEFRDKYRKIDVLLVDDIQFLSDKEGTQEEFFHTFNELYFANKQIVISSDKPPAELKTLEDRLRSRFGSGLIVDITLPDFETRIAILQKKAELEHVNVPSSIMQYIARNIATNIRELEGALNKITARAKLTNSEITPELAEKALNDIVGDKGSREITMEYIQEVVADEFKITVEDIRSKKRNANITYARHIAMYLSRKILTTTLIKIGEEFGGRDHSTIMYSCDKIAAEYERNNDELKNTLYLLEKKIRGNI